jgi:MFS family permease
VARTSERRPPDPGSVEDSESRSRFGRAFESLALRDFRLLWTSSVLSGFGQWGQQIGLNWLVFVLTDSAVQLGAVSFTAGLITLFLTPFAGLLADRYPRRAIMFWSSAFGAATAGTIAVLVITDLIEVWHAYAFALLSGVSMAINQPARQAAVFDTSTDETLQNAVAMNSIAMNLSRIVGPPLAGIIAVWSLSAAFALITVMRGLAAITVLAMSRVSRQERVEAKLSPIAQIWEGFRYLGSDARLGGLWFVNALPALIVYPYIALLPIFVSDVFEADADVFGLLLAMMGIGSTIGLLVLAVLPDLRHRGRWMLLGFIVYLGFILAFTRSDTLWISLTLLIAGGTVHGLALALNTTLFQTALRNEMRGRAMAAWQMGFSLMPLGALPMGFAVDRWGVQNGVGGFTLVCLIAFILIAIFWRPLRTMP